MKTLTLDIIKLAKMTGDGCDYEDERDALNRITYLQEQLVYIYYQLDEAGDEKQYALGDVMNIFDTIKRNLKHGNIYDKPSHYDNDQFDYE